MNKTPLLIKASTWLKSSHGLFDYESKNVVTFTYKTHDTGSIILNGDNCVFLPLASEPSETILAKITEVNNEFIIQAQKQDKF